MGPIFAPISTVYGEGLANLAIFDSEMKIAPCGIDADLYRAEKFSLYVVW